MSERTMLPGLVTPRVPLLRLGIIVRVVGERQHFDHGPALRAVFQMLGNLLFLFRRDPAIADHITQRAVRAWEWYVHDTWHCRKNSQQQATR